MLKKDCYFSIVICSQPGKLEASAGLDTDKTGPSLRRQASEASGAASLDTQGDQLNKRWDYSSNTNFEIMFTLFDRIDW